MVVMTAQPPLPMVAEPAAVPVGAAAALVEDADGGRVFLHGCLAFAWDARQDDLRRLAAVQLVATRAATVVDVAAAFGVGEVTVWRWQQRLAADGTAGMGTGKPGPKGPSKITAAMRAEILRRRAAKESFRAIAAAVGVSDHTVRRVVTEEATAADDDQGQDVQDNQDNQDAEAAGDVEVLPVLPAPQQRTAERWMARAGLLTEAAPVFAPAARVPLAGLLLALPAIEATGLLGCAKETYGALPAGFYGLDTVLLEAVFRTLAGEPRAEGATRIDPVALGRVLGMDRAPEVKTIRRKLGQLAARGQAAELLRSMATTKLAANQAADNGDGLAAVLYVDGHIRAYQGTRKIGKAHSTRLRFPAPATAETWVSDAGGDPVLMVMAEPGASLAGELRRLLPVLREVIGDQRRVLVGFDRGGWSPALFRHMSTHGFDVLTWRKGATEEVAEDLFDEIEYTDETGRTHRWTIAETTVELPVGQAKDGEVFAMRQITRLVDNGKKGLRQIHLLTTIPAGRASAGELLYRMGSRWRQENHFRYARMHFALDAHDCYAAGSDDPDRMVPNPAKKTAHQQVLATRARFDRAAATADAALLAARTPAAGHGSITLDNDTYNQITAPLRAAERDHQAAKAAHQAIPARVRLEQVAPGQQVLDTETKQLTHAIRIAAFNTVTTLARELRIHTGYARADDEAHTLIRQLLRHTGDIDTTIPGQLMIRLDPLPTARATTAAAQLCAHLTTAETRYPGTNLLMRYEVKNPT